MASDVPAQLSEIDFVERLAFLTRWRLDWPGRRLWLSRKVDMLRRRGASSIEYPVDVLFSSIVDPSYVSDMRAALRRAIRSKSPFSVLVKLQDKFQSSGHWIQVFGEVEFSSSGRVIAVQGVFQDAHEYVERLNRRYRLQREVEQAERSEVYGHVTGRLAHEVANLIQPAFSFSGLAQTFLEKQDLGRAAGYLNDAIAAITRVDGIVQQALMRSGELLPTLEVVTLSEILNSIPHIIAPELYEKIVVDAPKIAMGQRVQVSKLGLTQVLLNVLRNAIDAAGEHRKVFVLCNSVEANGDDSGHVLIDIIDNGPGFTPDALEQAFTPLFTTKSFNRGTGFGLAVVKSLVASWHGRVEIGNVKGKGGLVRIILPTHRPVSPAGRETTLSANDATT